MFQKIVYILRQLTPMKFHRFVRKSGLLQNTKEHYPSIKSTLRYLKRWGFDPSTAIDVGAYLGDWTKLFKSIFPASKVLMIEPQKDKFYMLKQVCTSFNGDVSLEMNLLGSEDYKEVVFVQMESGSSVFEEASPYDRKYLKEPLMSLDTLLESYPLFKQLDFLKLDVQGYELEVLKGAANLLQHTELVLMEASLIPINHGAPLLFEVMEFMHQKGFRLLDFCSHIRRHDGALWQTDLLFIHNYSRFMPKPELDAHNWG